MPTLPDPARIRLPLLAGAVAVLLAAGLVGTATVTPDAATLAPPATATTGGPAPVSGDEALRAEVARLQAYVTKTRGLAFDGPVPVVLLDDEAFKARVTEGADEDAEALEDLEQVLQALALIEDDDDIAAAVTTVLAEGTVGFYDPETNELVVRGSALTPGFRQVAVHELTHAAQDQRFDLHRPALDEADDERGLGFQALIEGDATRIDEAYLETLSAADRRRAEEENGGGDADFGSVPDVVLQLFSFPYAIGPAFVEAVVEAGGQARLDAAFQAPPTTSEQLLHPDRFLAGEAAKAVAEPAADAEVFDRGSLGELGILLLLQDVVDERQVVTAAEGWGGDRYVAWDAGGGRTCVRVAFVMDTDRDADELLTALRRWVADVGDAKVERAPGGPITFTTCG